MLSMYHIFRWRKKKAEADAMRCVSGDIMARPPEPSGPGASTNALRYATDLGLLLHDLHFFSDALRVYPAPLLPKRQRPFRFGCELAQVHDSG